MVKVLKVSLFCAIMLGISCTQVDTPELPPPTYPISSSIALSSSSLYYSSSYEWNVSSSSVLLSSSSSEEENSEVSSSSGEEVSSSSSNEEVSSSSVTPSSSSLVPSSSSVAPSSSSRPPSSSSVAPSSSSRPPSSSSVAPSSSSRPSSSSSVAPSSSSFDCLHTFINTSVNYVCSQYDSSKEFCDSRDAKIYKYVKIGTQTWMAENLDFNANSNPKCSACYENKEKNCYLYGRLYNWTTAMNISSTYETTIYNAPSKHKGICPNGWHLPDQTEWITLANYAKGDDNSAGEKLKSTSLWKITPGDNGSPPVPGKDTYGFTAMAGGAGHPDGNFVALSTNGIWWNAKAEESGEKVNIIEMGYNYKNILENDYGTKHNLYSIRCIKD